MEKELTLPQDLVNLEMSRYIDLDVYHAVERSHPFYVEMTDEILKLIDKHQNTQKDGLEILELGAGTGLFTEQLVQIPRTQIDALELDSSCVELLTKHVAGKARVIQGDAVKYSKNQKYDVVVSTFAHDHIHYDLANNFAANIRKNLKKGGIYLMGGEILPLYLTPAQRREALFQYHGYIVSEALRQGHYALAQLEINALHSGVNMVGDFKRHERLFEAEMLSSPFQLRVKNKIGPVNPNNVGGVFVYCYEAI